jgi:hypothetical protein
VPQCACRASLSFILHAEQQVLWLNFLEMFDLFASQPAGSG